MFEFSTIEPDEDMRVRARAELIKDVPEFRWRDALAFAFGLPLFALLLAAPFFYLDYRQQPTEQRWNQLVRTSAQIVISGTALCSVVAVYLVRRERQAQRRCNEGVERALSGPTWRRCSLTLDKHHVFAPHDHGLMFFAKGAGGGTWFTDISSIADDPWEKLAAELQSTGRAPERWTWVEPFAGFRPALLERTGDVVAVNIASHYEGEVGSELIEQLNLEYGAVNAVPFQRVLLALGYPMDTRPATSAA